MAQVYNPLLGPPPKAPAPAEPAPAPASTPAPEPKIAKKAWNDLDLPYPGTFEMLHSEVKSSLAANWIIDGAKVAVTKPVSNNFQVNHVILMGSQQEYHFGATYIGEPKFGQPEFSSPLLMGDITTEGFLSAQAHHWLTPTLKAKVVFQSAGKNAHIQTDLDYKGKDFAASVKAINPDIVNESGTWVASYLQSVTKSIALGGEMLYQYQGRMEDAGFSLAGRYRSDTATFTANASAMGQVVASYAHKVNDKIVLGAEIEANLLAKESVTTIGYCFDMRQNTVRGQINSKGVVAGVLDNKLAPGLSFILTGQLDHMSGKSTFGMGFLIGQ